MYLVLKKEGSYVDLFSGKCVGGLLYGRHICIKLLYNAGPGLNYAESVAVCQKAGGNLVDLTGNEMKAAVNEYLANTWIYYTTEPGRSEILAYVANTYEVSV